MQDSVDYDYVIVGAGPAGLQMAYFLQQAGQRYIVPSFSNSIRGVVGSFPSTRRTTSLKKKSSI